MSRVRLVLATALAAVAVAGLTWFFAKGALDGDVPLYATVLPERRPLPAFSLVDQDSRPFTLDRLRGQTSLVFFGFTHCPDICPATLQQLALARRRIAGNSPAGSSPGAALRIVLISVDPARDTPEILRQYVEYFGEGISGVTGKLDEIRKLASGLGIFFEKSGTGEHYRVNHSTAVLVIDRQARLKALFTAPLSVNAFVHDLPLLMEPQS